MPTWFKYECALRSVYFVSIPILSQKRSTDFTFFSRESGAHGSWLCGFTSERGITKPGHPWPRVTRVQSTDDRTLQLGYCLTSWPGYYTRLPKVGRNHPVTQTPVASAHPRASLHCPPVLVLRSLCFYLRFVDECRKQCMWREAGGRVTYGTRKKIKKAERCTDMTKRYKHLRPEKKNRKSKLTQEGKID